MATLAPRLLTRAARWLGPRIVSSSTTPRIAHQCRRVTTATPAASTRIPDEVVLAASASPAKPTAEAIPIAAVTPPLKKTRAKSTTAKSTASKTAAKKPSTTRAAKSEALSSTIAEAAPSPKTRTRKTKAKAEAEAEAQPIAAAKTPRTRKAAAKPKAAAPSPTPAIPKTQAPTASAPAAPLPPPPPAPRPAVPAAAAAAAQAPTLHNPDTGFSFSSSGAALDPESPAARQARGLAAAQHVAAGGKLPPRYKGAARRVTALIVALPFVIVGTPYVWERVVEGKERKVFPRPGEGGGPLEGGGESLGVVGEGEKVLQA